MAGYVRDATGEYDDDGGIAGIPVGESGRLRFRVAIHVRRAKCNHRVAQLDLKAILTNDPTVAEEREELAREAYLSLSELA